MRPSSCARTHSPLVGVWWRESLWCGCGAARCAGLGCSVAGHGAWATSDVLRAAVCARGAGGTAGVAGLVAIARCIFVAVTAGSCNPIIAVAAASVHKRAPDIVAVAATISSCCVALA